MKNILITGASGFLGHNLVKALLNRKDYYVFAVLGRPEDKANSLPIDGNIAVLSCDELYSFSFPKIDTLINCAFSRGNDLSALSSSLRYTKSLIEMINRSEIDSVINISTQGVYKGTVPGNKVDEDHEIVPYDSYALAKYAVENMFSVGCNKRFTHIRMASLSSNARFLVFFVNNVASGKNITVTSPLQYASIMDVSDAVEGILSVVSLPKMERLEIYNLGPEVQYSIKEYAETAVQEGTIFNYKPINVLVEDNGLSYAICMNCERLRNQTGWQAKVTKEMMLDKIFESL